MRREQVRTVMNTLLDLIERDRIVLVSSENRSGLKQLIAKAEAMSASAMGHAAEELEELVLLPQAVAVTSSAAINMETIIFFIINFSF